jgi:hypothetical protein
MEGVPEAASGTPYSSVLYSTFRPRLAPAIARASPSARRPGRAESILPMAPSVLPSRASMTIRPPAAAIAGHPAGENDSAVRRFCIGVSVGTVGRYPPPRAAAVSRRAGFSKSVLAASLDAAGIAYLHLRDLGTPKAGRDAARAGRTAEMQRIFAAHMAEPPAQAAFAKASALIGQRSCCLLCFEAEHDRCHRAILAEDFSRTLRCEVVHL